MLQSRTQTQHTIELNRTHSSVDYADYASLSPRLNSLPRSFDTNYVGATVWKLALYLQ